MKNKKIDSDGGAPAPFLKAADWNLVGRGGGSLSHAELLRALGRRLRAYYDNLFWEPVPPHLKPLVDKLDRKGEPHE